MNEWKDYFSKLLNAPPVIPSEPILPAQNDLPIETGDFSLEEINKAITSLNDNKAPGIDASVTAEAIKHGGVELTKQLLSLCNTIKRSNIPPAQ